MSAKLILFLFLFFSILLFAGYKLRSSNQKAAVTSNVTSDVASNSVPTGLTLKIISPADNSTIPFADIELQGQTSPAAEVFINELETIADDQGNFSFNLKLIEGENELAVAATDDEGNFAESILTITYTPEEL